MSEKTTKQIEKDEITLEDYKNIREQIAKYSRNENSDLLEKTLLKAIKIADELQLSNEMGELQIELGVLYWHKQEFKSALKYFRLSCSVYKDSPDKLKIVIATKNVGKTYIKLREYTNAITFLKLSLDLVPSGYDKDDKLLKNELRDIYLNLGTAFCVCKNYVESLGMYFKGLEISEREKNQESICEIHLLIGDLYYSMNQMKRALKFYNKCYDLSKISKLESVNADSLVKKGNVHLNHRNIEQALDFYRQAIEIYSKTEKNNQKSIKVYLLMADGYMLDNNMAKAIEICNCIMDKFKGVIPIINLVDLNIILGKAYYSENEHSNAEAYYNKALEAIEQVSSMDEKKSEIYQALADLYEKKDDFDKAFKALTQKNKFVEVVSSKKERKLISEIKAKFESQQQEREKIILREKNQELELLNRQIQTIAVKLREISKNDELTGALNKQTLIERLTILRNLSQRNMMEINMVLIKVIGEEEVDKKDFNKNIIKVSDTVRGHIRKQDVFGRWNESSFVLILPNTDEAGTDFVIKHIKPLIEIVIKPLAHLTPVFRTYFVSPDSDMESVTKDLDTILN